MKLGFIGIGNMAQAIINGISGSHHITISTRSDKRSQELAQSLNTFYAKDNQTCAQNADILFLCIKPEQFSTVIDEIRPVLKNQTIVSIAAKLTIEDIRSLLQKDLGIIRIMPNLNVTIKEGMSAIATSEGVDPVALTIVESIFQDLGQCVRIDEVHFSTFIGIAGSAPAFIFKFMNALLEEAKKDGLDPSLSLDIIAQTLSGSAHYLQKSQVQPHILVDRVCSKGGTTIEGVQSLDEDQFEPILQRAVRKTINKDKTSKLIT